MFVLADNAKVYLYAIPIDLRKSIDGLVQSVVGLLNKQPQSGDVYLFCNRGKDKLKALYWDGNGFVMYYKRMEKRRFIISRLLSGEVELSHEECQLLLCGADLMLRREYLTRDFTRYF